MINKDSIIASFLLVICGFLINAVTNIEVISYATISSEVWPAIVVIVLTLLCFIYFIKSILLKKNEIPDVPRKSFKLNIPFNVLVVFFMFGSFVYLIPFLGMLIGGFIFVFFTLNLIGRKSLYYFFIHFVIAIFTVAIMWLVFSYGLNVMLPEGELLYLLKY